MGLRKAINDMCKACIYDKYAAGNWRQQVSACTSPNCPLFQYRPKSSPIQATQPAATSQAELQAQPVHPHYRNLVQK